MNDDKSAQEIRELLLFANEGEGPVSGTELERRRDALWASNPRRGRELRTASASVEDWKRELRSGARTPAMTLAELEKRVAALERRTRQVDQMFAAIEMMR